jgi:hypothetical protein
MVGGGTNISAFGITPPPTGYYGSPFQNATGNNIGIDSSIPSPPTATAAPPSYSGRSDRPRAVGRARYRGPLPPGSGSLRNGVGTHQLCRRCNGR